MIDTVKRIKYFIGFYLLLILAWVISVVIHLDLNILFIVGLNLSVVYIVITGVLGLENKENRLLSILISWIFAIQMALLIAFLIGIERDVGLITGVNIFLILNYFLIKKYNGTKYLHGLNLLLFFVNNSYYWTLIATGH